MILKDLSLGVMTTCKAQPTILCMSLGKKTIFFSRYWLVTGLKWRLVRGISIKRYLWYLHLKRLPAWTSVASCNLGQNKWIISGPPLPPHISMMPKCRIFASSHLRHCLSGGEVTGGGEGGLLFRTIMCKIVVPVQYRDNGYGKYQHLLSRDYDFMILTEKKTNGSL